MENRSYLFIVDRLPVEGGPALRVRGVHENLEESPILHILAVSGDPVECPSLIWRDGLDAFEDGTPWPAPLAIAGDAWLGMENVEKAFARLPQTPENEAALAQARQALGEALEVGSYFVWEYAEISHEEAEEPWNVRRESEFMLSEVRNPESMIEAVGNFGIDSLLGSEGRWSQRLYQMPAGPHRYLGPEQDPALTEEWDSWHQASRAWAIGLVGLIPAPIVPMIIAGVAMALFGMKLRRTGRSVVARQHGTSAANWGVIALILAVISGVLVSLSKSAAQAADMENLWLIMLPMAVYIVLCVVNYLVIVRGYRCAKGGQPYRAPAIRLFR
ncbi:MAG: hypothetical protein QM705_08855 [Ancrocorticia sp.]